MSTPTFNEISPGSFIYTLDHALSEHQCAEIINRFEESPVHHVQGKLGQQGKEDKSIKRSTDLRVSGRDDWKDIDGWLQKSLMQGVSLMAGLHPFFKSNRIKDIGYNIQRTAPGEYYHWHVDSGPGEFSQRQLVAIWYLNSMNDDGETEFYFQNLSVTPTTGRLMLFPPFWTHVHRGKTVNSGVKYIATTWICFA